MIEKYTGENILFIPDIDFEEREGYIYKWTVDDKETYTGFYEICSFDKPGTHRVQLIITDKDNALFSTYLVEVNITSRSQHYALTYTDSESLGFGISEFGISSFGE